MTDTEGVEMKRLCDLRVTDIKAELEKRGLDKTGIKSALQERLQKALQDEGADPEEFLFEISGKMSNHLKNGEEAEEDELEDDELENGVEQPDENDQMTEDSLLTLEVKDGVWGPEAGDGEVPVDQEREMDEDTPIEAGDNYQEDSTMVDAAGDFDHGAKVDDSQNGDEDIIGEPDLSMSDSQNVTSRNEAEAAVDSGEGVGVNDQAGASDPAVSGETRDDTFVVQVEDNMLNDIDSDLLDGEGKVVTAAEGSAQNKKAATPSKSTSSTSVTKTGTKAPSSKEDKDSKSATKSAPSKAVKKDDKVSQTSRNLWVSELSSSTRATDLKTLFSKHGKVLGAKVVTNARAPGSRCYGFVTMSTADEATKCMQNLHRTELHGRMISVERAKTEPQGSKNKVLPPSNIKSLPKSSSRTASDRKTTPRKDDERHSSTKDKDVKDKDKELTDKEKKELDVLSFEKIKAEREQERLRRKEQYLRHEERRRQLARERDRVRDRHRQELIARKQREESIKIDREKRRLREMREELERERIETERLRLETERLQMAKEQEEYRREQQRVLQDRRPVKRVGERPVREDDWPPKRHVSERFERKPVRREERPPRSYEGRREGAPRHERYEEVAERHPTREVRERDYEATGGRRGAAAEEHHRPAYRREEHHRAPREARSAREDPSRESRGGPRHESRSEWKSEREPSRATGAGAARGWNNGASERKVVDTGSGSWGGHQAESWDSGAVVMSQPGGGTATFLSQAPVGTVYIAQPTPVVMQGARQGGDSRYAIAQSTVRRY